MLYSRSANIATKRCATCGEPFMPACEKCGAALPNQFSSPVYAVTARPVNMPKRPDHCRECGHGFPWKDLREPAVAKDFWDTLHPQVVAVSRDRFNAKHYADAVEAAFKALNVRVKAAVKGVTGEEHDGASLMRHAFSPKNPVVVLDDLGTETGRSIQQGYMDIFAGSMMGIRNPKAHEIIHIDPARAMHHLFLASLLFHKLDEAIEAPNNGLNPTVAPRGRGSTSG